MLGKRRLPRFGLTIFILLAAWLALPDLAWAPAPAPIPAPGATIAQAPEPLPAPHPHEPESAAMPAPAPAPVPAPAPSPEAEGALDPAQCARLGQVYFRLPREQQFTYADSLRRCIDHSLQ